MKHLLSAIVVGFILIGCAPHPARPTIPPNSKLCSSDLECIRGRQYCGFVPGYDAAVCRNR